MNRLNGKINGIPRGHVHIHLDVDGDLQPHTSKVTGCNDYWAVRLASAIEDSLAIDPKTCDLTINWRSVRLREIPAVVLSKITVHMPRRVWAWARA